MSIVSFALRRPITVIVMAIAILVMSLGAIVRTPRDILPQLGIPVIYVAQPFGGMSPAQMEGFLTYYYEYHFLYITGIEHVESKSIQGTSLIKLQFHPGTDMATAMAETVSYVNRARAFMPPGTLPPFIMRFDAGSVPIGNLVFESETLTVGAIQDMALNRVRPMFATLPGVSAPPPFGGSARTIVIRTDPNRLTAYHLTPDDVITAVSIGHTISPAGSAYIGDKNPIVPSNSLISDIKEFGQIPLRVGADSRIYLRDVAKIEDASDIPTAVALINGHRTVYIPVTKRANASTMAVVGLVKANLSRFQAALPSEVKVSYQFDQSGYVSRAIAGLTQEGLLGAFLAGAMVLLFLRDWRSALIIVVNIPLALAGALIGLSLTGQTVNLMTLGGLALAVGILVDESTVTVENVHFHLAQGKPLRRAVADSGKEVALPLLVSMLCILAVFIPSFFMTGAAQALFAPLALAVGFSMMASYLLSRTLVPVLCCWFLHPHSQPAKEWPRLPRPSLLLTLILYIIAIGVVLLLVMPKLGVDIFPPVDQGQFQLRLRAPAGTQLEKTEALVLQVLQLIERVAGKDNLQISLAFLGTQPSSYPINNIYLWTSGPAEAVLQIQIRPGTAPIETIKENLRREMAQAFPDVDVSFEPSDIISRVLSFGSPTPVEVAVSGPDLSTSRAFAERIRERLQKITNLRDVHYGQTLDYPSVEVNIDRLRAAEQGVSVASIARSVLAATSSSRFVTPSYWADPKSGIAYNVQIEIPRSKINSVSDLQNLPVNSRTSTTLLRNVAEVKPGTAVGEFDRYNMQRSVTLNANYVDSDLGEIARQVRSALSSLESDKPSRVAVALRGQIPPLEELQSGLLQGLGVAVLIIMLLLWANFQSFKAALVVLGAVPAALSGAMVALWVTSTSLNLESFMGMIMAVGVGVANAILLVSSARKLHADGLSAAEAATEALQTRIRPITMTALAMAAGMLPMSLGLGESGQQTAPLGRAVEGGLLGSTLAALFVLPALYTFLCRGSIKPTSLDPDDPESQS